MIFGLGIAFGIWVVGAIGTLALLTMANELYVPGPKDPTWKLLLCSVFWFVFWPMLLFGYIK